MNRFERPSTALTQEQFDALPALAPLWEIYGVCLRVPNENPCMLKMSNVLNAEESGNTFGNWFEYTYPDKNGNPEIYSHTKKLESFQTSAKDANLIENNYNDNYLFASYEDAVQGMSEMIISGLRNKTIKIV